MIAAATVTRAIAVAAAADEAEAAVAVTVRLEERVGVAVAVDAATSITGEQSKAPVGAARVEDAIIAVTEAMMTSPVTNEPRVDMERMTDDPQGTARIERERFKMETAELSEALTNVKKTTALRTIEANTMSVVATADRAEATMMTVVAIEARVEATMMTMGRMTKHRKRTEAMVETVATIKTLIDVTTTIEATMMAVEMTAVPAEATAPTINRRGQPSERQMAAVMAEVVTGATTTADTMPTSAGRQMHDIEPSSTRCASELANHRHM